MNQNRVVLDTNILVSALFINRQYGVKIFPMSSTNGMIDEDDRIFYDVGRCGKVF